MCFKAKLEDKFNEIELNDECNRFEFNKIKAVVFIAFYQ